MRAIAADLLDPASLQTALTDVAPTHMFITAWMRQATEAENIRVNGAMVRHVSLVTGLKHYLGPFEACASAVTLPKPRCAKSSPDWPSRIFMTNKKTKSSRLPQVTASAGTSTDRTPSSARPLAMR